MRSFTSRRFREQYAQLPADVRLSARRAFRLFRQNPAHPGLRFKKVNEAHEIYSVRVGIGYRALAQREGDDLIWFWIGSHAEYDKLV